MTSAPPHGDDLPDEVTDAYRRLSETEVARPRNETRAAILAQARHATQTPGPRRGRPIIDWRWKAAASLAVVGLVGVLTLQSLRSRPPLPTSQSALVTQSATSRQAPLPEAQSVEVAPNSPPAVRHPPHAAARLPKGDDASTQIVVAAQKAAAAPAPAAPALMANAARAPSPATASAADRARVAAAGAAHLPLDNGKVGHAFPVSESVWAECRKELPQAGVSAQGHCAPAMEMLNRLAQEPRDPDWARTTEDEIRKFIDATPPGNYSIRSLECRQRICAVEIAAPLEPYPAQLLQRRMVDADFGALPESMSASEADSHGQPIYVTDLIYFRPQRP